MMMRTVGSWKEFRKITVINLISGNNKATVAKFGEDDDDDEWGSHRKILLMYLTRASFPLKDKPKVSIKGESQEVVVGVVEAKSREVEVKVSNPLDYCVNEGGRSYQSLEAFSRPSLSALIFLIFFYLP